MTAFAPMLRLCSRVKRWNINHVIHEQSIAEHMFYVAHYAMEIAMLIGRQDLMPQCAAYAVCHDVDETIIGDIPGPAKRQFMKIDEEGIKREMVKVYGPEWAMNVVTPSDADLVKIICKVADYVDEIMYCSLEISKGNRANATAMRQRSHANFNRWLDKLPIFEQVRLQIAKLVEDQAVEIESRGYAREG